MGNAIGLDLHLAHDAPFSGCLFNALSDATRHQGRVSLPSAEAERVAGQIFAIPPSSLAKVAITKSRFPATGTGSILLGIRFSKSDCGQHSTPRERAASGATHGAQTLAIVTTKARRWQFDFAVNCSMIAAFMGL